MHSIEHPFTGLCLHPGMKLLERWTCLEFLEDGQVEIHGANRVYTPKPYDYDYLKKNPGQCIAKS